MARGQLRIYLGAAPGVGKTYAMLDEGWRRQGRGTDVVVGYVETHGRLRTAEQLRDIEVVPRRRIQHRGATFEEMDLDAVLARQPEVALIDELAHTNVPGSRNTKRWQDVEDLLAAGIDVVSTVNVQHLESVNDVVEEITGVRQQETVPDEVVRAADQIELVDMTPEALRRRMAHGNIYTSDKVDAALANYFRVGNLSALRELALLWTADRVDESMREYRQSHGIQRPWETRERIVVAMTGAASGEALVRRASRMAERSHAELLGIHVRSDAGVEEDLDRLANHRRLLGDLGGAYHEVVGADPAESLVRFAVTENATQLVLGASGRGRWREVVAGGSVINRVIRRAREIDVHVISPPEVATANRARLLPLRRRRPATLSTSRRLAGWAMCVTGIPVLALVLIALESHLNLPSEMLLCLLLVGGVAVVGGLWPALVAAVATSLVVNWFFTPPVHTWTIAQTDNVVALVVFVLVAVLVSLLVSRLSQRSADAARARAEAEAIAAVAGNLVDAEHALEVAVGHVRSTFGLDAVAVLRPNDGDGYVVEASAGEPVPTMPDTKMTVDLRGGALLVLDGPVLHSDDLQVLQAFVGQMSAAIEHRDLRAEAQRAATAAEGDKLRTAILRAVSHDLRTPLASIKASVSSLKQDDVDWSAHDREEFLATIEEETDRLNRTVGNLLDMSRLESGTVQPTLRAVALEEIVPRALVSISGADALELASVQTSVPEDLPTVLADPDLLERVVANIVANALRHGTGPAQVRVEAGLVGEEVHLRVIDHGVGIPFKEREQLFEPFQRLGDNGHDVGVGLGLAVARGFMEAMGGELVLEDTPGGGLTFTMSLRTAP